MDNETIYTAIKIGALITGSYYIGRYIGKCILSDYITKVLGSSQISFTSKDKTDGLILRDNLIKLKDKYPDLKLVLAGHDHYFWQRIKKEFQDPDIIYKGYVSDEELVTLYKNAKAFVMPSFEEGFGIPILEAMALSCPVVSSNAGSLPEVGGDACLYFDPTNMSDMTNKINKIINDENLRKDLIKKGLQRYKKFSWKKLAEQTLEVYENSISS